MADGRKRVESKGTRLLRCACLFIGPIGPMGPIGLKAYLEKTAQAPAGIGTYGSTGYDGRHLYPSRLPIFSNTSNAGNLFH